MTYKSLITGKIYQVEPDTQVRFPCPKCGAWLFEKFDDSPHKCHGCGYGEVAE